MGLPLKKEISKDIVDNYRTMFESRISAGRLEKLPFPQNIRISSWSLMTWLVMQKKCVERYCELANKTTQQLYKVSTPCIDDHHFKEEEQNLLENCQIHALKLFWNVYIGKNWTTWYFMVRNKLARSITKWTKACWQTLESIDFIYSSYEWIQTILSCGKYC